MKIRGLEKAFTFLLRLVFPFNHVGHNVSIHPSCDIRRAAAPYIFLGNGVRLAQGVWLNVPFETPPPHKEHPVIRIGDGTAIGRRCTLSALHCIDIGPNVLLAPGALVMDHSHGFSDAMVPISMQGTSLPGRVIIEEGCWLGHNCAIITHKGRELRLGRNSIVGANSVVTRSFPPNSVLVGLPARNVGTLTRADAQCRNELRSPVPS